MSSMPNKHVSPKKPELVPAWLSSMCQQTSAKMEAWPPCRIKEILAAITIPIMAKARIGHFVECQILQSIGVDYVDESEVLMPADNVYQVDKTRFMVPFACGCRNLGEALRRIGEGAAMFRNKGEAGTGDVMEAVMHMRTVEKELAVAKAAYEPGDEGALRAVGCEIECDLALLTQRAELGRFPVVNFPAESIATSADAALMMQLGCEGVFVGSGIFKSGNCVLSEGYR